VTPEIREERNADTALVRRLPESAVREIDRQVGRCRMRDGGGRIRQRLRELRWMAQRELPAQRLENGPVTVVAPDLAEHGEARRELRIGHEPEDVVKRRARSVADDRACAPGPLVSVRQPF